MSTKFTDKDGKVLLDTENIGTGGSVDLSNHYTKDETDKAISTAIENIEIDTSGVTLADIGYQVFEGNNIYIKAEHYKTGYVNSDGTMKSTTAGGYVEIPVVPHKAYIIHRKRVDGYADIHFKDNDGNIIANYPWSATNYHLGKMAIGEDIVRWVICPEGATIMYFTAMLQGRDDSEDLIVYESGAFPKEGYLTYNPIIEPLRNKRWFAVGDSITEMNGRTTDSRNGYVDKVQKRTGILAYNLGISGTGYRRSTNFYTRVDIIPSDADYITIYGSINDMYSAGANPTYGELTDTVEGGQETYCGYINSTLNKIIAKCPNAKLGVITPIPAREYGSGGSLATTNPGNKLEMYAKKIKEICEYRGIPCLDLYHQSNLHPELIDIENPDATWSQIYYSTSMKAGSELDTDGVHPNEKGHELIANRVVEFLKSL